MTEAGENNVKIYAIKKYSKGHTYFNPEAQVSNVRFWKKQPDAGIKGC